MWRFIEFVLVGIVKFVLNLAFLIFLVLAIGIGLVALWDSFAN